MRYTYAASYFHSALAARGKFKKRCDYCAMKNKDYLNLKLAKSVSLLSFLLSEYDDGTFCTLCPHKELCSTPGTDCSRCFCNDGVTAFLEADYNEELSGNFFASFFWSAREYFNRTSGQIPDDLEQIEEPEEEQKRRPVKYYCVFCGSELESAAQLCPFCESALAKAFKEAGQK